MATFAPLILVGFIVGHLLTFPLMGWPTKRFLSETPRLTASGLKHKFPEMRWAIRGYPLFTFLWFFSVGLLSFVLIMTIAVFYKGGATRFEMLMAAAISLWSSYMNAVIGFGTGLFEMRFKISGTGGTSPNYYGWPTYNKGAKIGGERVPYVYLAGEEVAQAGRWRVLLSTAVFAVLAIIWAGIAWFVGSG